MKLSIIPELSDIERVINISGEYHAGWEYNDFCDPSVYDNPEEVTNRINRYRSINRSRDIDTMHGAFLGVDVTAADKIFRDRSRQLCIQSLDIARRLNIKGVVFHTGLIGELQIDSYINRWLEAYVDFWTDQCKQYSDLMIYIENSFEQNPDIFVKLMSYMKDFSNFKICLDYGHAVLTKTPVEVWFQKLAPYIGHMHLNDNDLKDDLHLVPGMGKIDFEEWKILMNKYKLKPTVLLELKGYEKELRALQYISNL